MSEQEALRSWWREWSGIREADEFLEAFFASDWLRDHDAALVAQARRDAAEEALREAARDYGPAQLTGCFRGRDGYTKAWLTARADAIARARRDAAETDEE